MSGDGGILPWLRTKRIVVVLGAGGVGKTTTSIVLALAAARQGRKVALLSIDPAKRLAAALGIPLGNQLRPLALPSGTLGTVDAAMLDQKAVFDAMVRKHAPSDVAAGRILANPVYKAASTNLSGPLEYMALAKLQELSEDHRYDLIVLDTPPDTHALDFLARPNVLAGFMEHKVMTWLVRPFQLAGRFGLGRLLNAGERLMGGVAKVAGMSALHLFAEFLVLMQEVIEGFHQSGEKTQKLLSRPDTGFQLVTVPTQAAARSAVNIGTQLKAMGYRAEVILFNRCLPDAVAREVAAWEATGAEATQGGMDVLAARLRGEVQVVAELKAKIKAPGLRLDDQEQDLGSLEALLAMATLLEKD